MIVLFAHVRTGKWASIMPAKLADTLGLTENVRSIPIVEPAATHAVGLIVPEREPMTPLIAALVAEARQLTKILKRPLPGSTVNGRELGARSAQVARPSRIRNPNRAIKFFRSRLLIQSAILIARQIIFIDFCCFQTFITVRPKDCTTSPNDPLSRYSPS
jgi:hypothetical protein